MALSRFRLGAAVGLAFTWQWLLGIAIPGALTSPSADPGLCLALAWRIRGGSWNQGIWIWALLLASSIPLQGAEPFWTFLLGLPAWLALAHKPREGFGFLASSVLTVVVSRCGGKLLLLGLLPGFAQTLSGANIGSSLWSEAASTSILISLFVWLLGDRRS